MSPKAKGITVGAACVAVGAIAGIAGAAAAPSTKKPNPTSAPQKPPALRWQLGHGGGPPGARPAGDGPAVHEDAIVLNRAGTAFIHATEDSGTVVSVTGDQLTLKEGIGHVTYKNVTLTIPSGASVIRNFATAKLSDLKAGDRVRVTQSSDGTSVFADNGSARPGLGRQWKYGTHGYGPGPGGPPPAGAPGPPGRGAGGPSGLGSGGAGPPGPPPLGA